jgi:hypothetical protein
MLEFFGIRIYVGFKVFFLLLINEYLEVGPIITIPNKGSYNVTQMLPSTVLWPSLFLVKGAIQIIRDTSGAHFGSSPPPCGIFLCGSTDF